MNDKPDNHNQNVDTDSHNQSLHGNITPSKTRRFKPFKDGHFWKSPGIIVFIVLFAAIGSYLIFKSFAVSNTPIRIIAGYSGSNVVDGKGNTWTKDTGYFTGGKTYSYSGDIANTTDDALFRNSRSGANGSTFSYNFNNLANGTYTVKLYLAELWNDQYGTDCVAGRRTFSVTGNSTPILTNFEIFTAAGGCRTAYITGGTNVTVSNGTLNLNFTRGNSGSDPNPTVNAIEIIPVTTTDAPPTVSLSANPATVTQGSSVALTANASDDKGVSKVDFYDGSTLIGTDTSSPYTYSWATSGSVTTGSHSLTAKATDTANQTTTSSAITVTVNAASTPPPPSSATRIISGYAGASYKDTAGNTWVADNYSTSGKSYADPNTISNTSDPTLFKQSRSGSSGNTFDYNIPMTNGSYTLKLYFAEIWTPNCAVNKRTFDVTSNGTTLLTNFDIYAKAGCETADTESFPVAITNGILNLHFTAGTTGAADPNPTVNAIEVISSASGPDTEKPSIPAGLSAVVQSSSVIKLTWNASTDNVGVAKYEVYRNGSNTPLAYPTTSSFTDQSLSASTPYTYKVDACDAAGNCSDKSTQASATTQAPPDATSPSAPSNVTASGASSSSIQLTWGASTDSGTGLAGYNVYRNGSKVASNLTGTSYTDTGLTANTTYSYIVEACDKASPPNCAQSTASGTTQIAVDTTPPTAPGNFKAIANSSTQVSLSWNASTDPESPSGITYTVTRNGTPIATKISNLSLTDNGVVSNTNYQYAVVATNTANLPSTPSTASVTTPQAPDTIKPSVPTNLNGSAISISQINLTWSASTDTGGSGLAGYRIYRCSYTSPATSCTLPTTPTYSVGSSSTSFGDTIGINSSTTYTYAVSAYDGAGNASVQSATKNITTPSTPPPPPSDCTSFVNPGSLSAVASAFNGLGSGGILCLNGGTYAGGNVTLSKSGTAGAPLTIKSTPGSTAILDGASVGLSSSGSIVNITGAYVTYSDLEMRNSSGRGITTTGASDIVQNSKFHDMQFNGLIAGTGSNNALIQNNEVYNTVMSNLNDAKGTSGWAEAFNTFQSTNTTFRNNYIHNNWGEGIDFLASSGGLADGNRVEANYSVQIYDDGTGSVTITNNKLGDAIPGANRNTNGVLLGDEGNTGNVKNIVINNNLFYGAKNSGIGFWGIVTRSAYTASGNQRCTNADYTSCTAYNP